MLRLLFLLLLPGMAFADIYKCPGPNGLAIFQKSPCPNAVKLEIKQPPPAVLARMRQQEQALDLREHQRRVRDAELDAIKTKQRAWDQWRQSVIASEIRQQERHEALLEEREESARRLECLQRQWYSRRIGPRC